MRTFLPGHKVAEALASAGVIPMTARSMQLDIDDHGVVVARYEVLVDADLIQRIGAVFAACGLPAVQTEDALRFYIEDGR